MLKHIETHAIKFNVSVLVARWQVSTRSWQDLIFAKHFIHTAAIDIKTMNIYCIIVVLIMCFSLKLAASMESMVKWWCSFRSSFSSLILRRNDDKDFPNWDENRIVRAYTSVRNFALTHSLYTYIYDTNYDDCIAFSQYLPIKFIPFRCILCSVENSRFFCT